MQMELSKEKIKQIQEGFKILKVVMKDQDTREIFWDSKKHFENFIESEQHIEAHFPKETLSSKAITRSIEFSSVEKLKNLSFTQKAFLGDQVIETLNYRFGFVIPNSTNNWDQTILSAGPGQMIPVNVLSGNLKIVISFFECKIPIYEVNLKIFYE